MLTYRSLRSAAATRNLDLIMVEHRGVGLSRQDPNGTDLPPEALTVDQVVADLAAVLDDCGVDRAVVYGSSYGTYLAQGLGVRHPDRVAGMVLDSPILTAHNEAIRTHLRALLWDGTQPETAAAARLMRDVVAHGAAPVEEIGAVAQIVYECAGPRTLERLLALRLGGRGRRSWNQILGLGEGETSRVHRYLSEFDLVGVIAFRELGYAPRPDGRPLDPDLWFVEPARRFPAFAGEPYDLPAALPRFGWPTAVVSGERDLRTPWPVAERVVDLVPDAVLVPRRHRAQCPGHPPAGRPTRRARRPRWSPPPPARPDQPERRPAPAWAVPAPGAPHRRVRHGRGTTAPTPRLTGPAPSGMTSRIRTSDLRARVPQQDRLAVQLSSSDWLWLEQRFMRIPVDLEAAVASTLPLGGRVVLVTGASRPIAIGADVARRPRRRGTAALVVPSSGTSTSRSARFWRPDTR